MKTIGLIGGMSWESTVPYYRIINEAAAGRLGGLHSARIVMVSVDFAPLAALMQAGDWPAVGEILADAARTVEGAGADCLLICTNTMHKMADTVQAAVTIPLIHIADVTAKAVLAAGITTVGLLGTRFTMEEDFYVGRLAQTHGLTVLVPGAEDRELVHRVIFDELCLGKVTEASRQAFARIIGELSGRGAEGVILGCTEIAMLVDPAASAIPLFDTTQIHALSAVDWALGGDF